MAQIRFFKVATLPGTLEPDSFYFVENGSYSESYLTNSAGVARSIGNSTMINALINEALSSLPGTGAPILFVADIAARDALEPEGAIFVLVQDASADPTVESGAALYAWNPATSAWLKVAEYESMDVELNWDAINGRPTSTPAQIDTAVSQAHTHANKSTLDKFGEESGLVRFNGQPIPAEWNGTAW
ncbi:hypothetical protein IPC609_14785 [Pseudomonas aeruginosa]|uniref:hypothetical protein n=1 Tax=Pseudomonas aeruginosa TaxID=287 RepID=UPI001067316A|nr:hypothetical protein [Pseudomonas aeruginosa]TEJ51188.1 hypothetical protein IPC610_29585 [Pseudomonas aeruginosa]TEJ71194.1 hypothetical protein IPC608_20190 [Pseudomonas aeruginosa]TEJ76809.1 hypothetical protein IPC609_14785 [Pseudomonas aeruginosa]